MEDIFDIEALLLARIETSEQPSSVLKAPEFKQLYARIPTLAPQDRSEYGGHINAMRQKLEHAIEQKELAMQSARVVALDVTVPFEINGAMPQLLPTEQGSSHPLRQEIAKIIDIFGRMGFAVAESREIDNQYNMFESLNFPKDHPARDDYDTFMTVQKDKDGAPFIAPAHTSTMQNRLLRQYSDSLAQGEPIAAIVPDRVFRNEDLDARHEHTFYQVEGVYVAKGVHAGMLIATLQNFLSEYYAKSIKVRVNPFYFPFTEPSFEMALSCPFCDGKESDCKVCSGEGWIELLGCGMIHPNVLRAANIDPNEFTGFAFGCGIDRLVMMKHGIEDVRYFESAKLDFLKQF